LSALRTSLAPTDKEAPPLLGFRWRWRPYQQRVLDALADLLSDQKLHVVAAPGSGKTCLGLEVFRRLGKPGLVLSPTRTIRDQWLARLADFLPAGSTCPPSWSSTSLDQPGYLSSVTYQALHTRHRQSSAEPEEDYEDAEEAEAPSATELKEVARRLRGRGVGTLIFDEAHHLRREWWEALAQLIELLPGTRVVSLTATPPYDVVGAEWQRYEQLCGPIDEQISVPELVRAGTLSPHQDYVLAVAPAPGDSAALAAYDAAAETVRADLLHDAEFLRIVRRHPWVYAPEWRVEEIFEDPELLSALLIYLHACQQDMPRPLLKLLDCRPEDLPPFDRAWCQVLVQRYLSGQTWPLDAQSEPHRAALAKRLRDAALLWRHEVHLQSSPSLRNRLRLTKSKVEACVAIYKLESDFRKAALRQVVLADFIRDDGSGRLGANPIFHALLREIPAAEQPGLALLTGRLAILHERLTAPLSEVLGERASALALEPLAEFPSFVRVTLNGAASTLVDAFTKLLGLGQIRVLVGTRSLLGEGWDAPAINSLVLASFVGSYMLTNQMRGRALRTDPVQPEKASSIWHIVAFDPTTPAGGADYEELIRRFHSFVGLAENRPLIEAGLERLDLPALSNATAVRLLNQQSATRLQQSGNLGQRWATAIEQAQDGRVLPCVAAQPAHSLKRLLFLNTLKYLVYSACCAGVTAVSWFTQLIQVDSFPALVVLFGLAGLVGLAVAGPKLTRAAFLWLRCLPVDGSLRQIGLAVRDAMAGCGLLETDRRRLKVRTADIGHGQFSISLAGGTYRESNLFADAMQEVLGPVENPRYLLTRGRAAGIPHRRDYHAVPRALATDKEKAVLFHRHWQWRLGRAELIYTRSEAGRRQLLKARTQTFSNSLQPRALRLDRWH
jgi:superfamily II DNA or RNA helicase